MLIVHLHITDLFAQRLFTVYITLLYSSLSPLHCYVLFTELQCQLKFLPRGINKKYLFYHIISYYKDKGEASM